MQISAAVIKEQGGAFCIEDCELDSPRANEVLVEVEAAGVCHTDIAARDQYMPVPLPAVLGHEGVGRILQLGEGVSEFAVGDRVLMSFGSCGQCKNCLRAAPGYCDQGLVYQVLGSRTDGSSPISQHGNAITGHFFAQSSFAISGTWQPHRWQLTHKPTRQRHHRPLLCSIVIRQSRHRRHPKHGATRQRFRPNFNGTTGLWCADRDGIGTA